MLYQSYRPVLSLTIYISLVILFVAAIAFSILFNKELIAALGIFSFSIVIRLMYYVSTNFSVLPYGDPYGQYTVLRVFSETSHVAIFPTSNFLNFLTRIPHQYSEWPGFQAFSIALSRITNLPLFWTALTIPFMLYGIWFVISYTLVKRIFANFRGSSSTLSVVSIGIAAALPTFEMPIIYKYDFLAAVLLLGFILLLTYAFDSHIVEKSLLSVLLITAIVVTHSLTALFLIIFVTMLGIAFVIRAFLPILIPRFKSSSLFARSTRYRGHFSFPKLIGLVLASVAVWWIFYATYVLTYASKGINFLLVSFSLQVLSLSRVGGQRGSIIGTLTPNWLIQLLHYRDEALLGLLVLGTVVLIVRPRILGKRLLIAAILFAIGVVTLVTEVSRTLNFGDRAFLTFAPILACFMILPVAVIVSRKPSLGKLGGIVILMFFMISVGLGFWGSSYAPTFLYSNHASAYAFGEHPQDWQQVSNYMNYPVSLGTSTNQTCILTNEVYVTSLVLPVQELGVTYPFTDIRARPGCVAIIFDTLTHFNSSYVSEPYNPYSATPYLASFSDNTLTNILSNESDLVFDGGNATIYYVG